nr:APC family permease [Kineococcus vitellinus]
MAVAGAPPSALAYVAATVVVVLVGSCIGQFSRRMVAPGSLYSFTAKGLGGVPALAAGGSLLVGYGFLVAGALTGAATCAAALAGRLLPPAAGPVPVAVGVACAGALVAGAALRGAGVSARLALALEVVSISVVAAVLLVLLTRTGAGEGADLLGGDPSSPFGPGGQGLLLAVTAFVGFESAGALATESRRPLLVVPRAVRWTALVAGLLYVLAAAAQSVVLAHAGPGVAGAPVPLASAAALLGSPALAAALELGVLASFLGCASGSLTALVRLLFTMGREGVVPRALGRTGRAGTPGPAVLLAGALAVAVPVAVLLAGVPVQDALRGLLVVGTCGYLAGYLLVCLAVPSFLHRIGELTPAPLVRAVLAVAALAAVLAACTAWALAAGGGWVLAGAALVALALARALLLRVRRPLLVAGVGLYDETRRQDVLGGRG